MRGVVSGVVPDGTYGQITAEDGRRYSYWSSEVRNGPVRAGQTVEFQMWEGQPVDIFVVAAPAPPSAPPRAGAAPQRAYAPAGMQMATAPASGVAVASMAGEFPKSSDYWIKLFTSPSGRISRRQFWLHGVLPIVVANVLLAWIPLIGQLIALVLLWANICICFKRFHDVGYPGWYSLIAVIPVVAAGVIVTVGMVSIHFIGIAWLLAEILMGLTLVIWLVQLIFVYIKVGQEGPNQYGPDPLAA